MKRVVLMRHGQSIANANEIFQGAGSSPLTTKGRVQARLAGTRLAGQRFAIVESSTLERAIDTAREAGHQPVPRPIWKEGDIGQWEGIDAREVETRYAEELERLNHDFDLRMGVTGETPRHVAERGATALEDIVARLDDGESALVVSHGGLIGALLWHLLELPTGRRRLGLLTNTAFTELFFHDYGLSLGCYNDAAHLGTVADWAGYLRKQGAVVVDLIRHGVTYANLERRVQGQQDDGLHPKGRLQARRLRDWIGDPDVDTVYSSSLGRALETAEIVFDQPAAPVDELMEISLGEWEGQMWDDLEAAGKLGGYPGDGNDIRRGHTGETWGDVQRRVSGFLNRLQSIHPGERVAATSHGGAIRAYVGSILGFDFGKARLIGPLRNTSLTQAIIDSDGYPQVAAYNLAPHLES